MRITVEQRIDWDDLPDPRKREIESRTGPIIDVRLTTAGQNSPASRPAEPDAAVSGGQSSA
jgi:hypothetical protein